MKKILFIFSILLSINIFNVNAVSFQASTPTSTVAVGQVFRLVYSVNVTNPKDIRIPEMSFFNKVAGPYESTSSSIQVINGNVKSSGSVAYTYTFLAKKVGTFTVPPATIYVDNQRYTSNSLTIRVLASDKMPKAQRQQQSSRSNDPFADDEDRVVNSSKISNNNVFIKVTPSRVHLFEQDYLVITYKLYSTVDLVGFTNNVKLPSFNGFLKQEVPLPQNKQMKLENYNGRNYGTVVLYQALLYPQQTGTITIDKANFEAIIKQRTRSQIGGFFNNFFDTYQDVKKMLYAPAIKITVDKLPSNKPAGFSGAVGSFSFKSSVSSNNVNVNDPISLKYVISGNGNLKLIKNPAVDFPSDFETYDPKVNNNFKTASSGVSGTKTVEYLLIPRSAGDFTIPAYKFSYFDLNSRSYKVISTPEYKIHVNKGNGKTSASNQAIISNFANQEQLKMLGKDIRYINTDKLDVSDKSDYLFGGVGFWLAYLLPLLLAGTIFYMYRKQVRENADIISVKNRKANKIAIKRLKTANKYLQENKKEQFYDEVLKALWGYLSDKLSIPVSALSKDNVVDELNKRNVEEADIKEFMDVLSVCEFARYAPSTDSHAMDDLYQRAITVISKFQETIK